MICPVAWRDDTQCDRALLRQALFRLGECHEKGLGVARDMDKAVELYKKASENGCEDAANRLKTLGK